jgi:hypothetical protein
LDVLVHRGSGHGCNDREADENYTFSLMVILYTPR